MYGAAFMAAVFILNRLAARLITQETLATQRGKHLKIQQAINQLVISSMDDGLIVVGSDGRIFASNPSVDKKLGMNLHPEGNQTLFLSDIPSLSPLSDAFFRLAGKSPDTPQTIWKAMAPTSRSSPMKAPHFQKLLCDRMKKAGSWLT